MCVLEVRWVHWYHVIWDSWWRAIGNQLRNTLCKRYNLVKTPFINKFYKHLGHHLVNLPLFFFEKWHTIFHNGNIKAYSLQPLHQFVVLFFCISDDRYCRVWWQLTEVFKFSGMFFNNLDAITFSSWESDEISYYNTLMESFFPDFIFTI